MNGKIKRGFEKKIKIESPNFIKNKWISEINITGAMVQLKILNRDLRSIHPSLQIPKPEYRHKDVYTHRKFYSGGSCSPK
jgi:hypothetical protein